MEINFEKEFIELGNAVAECHLKLGYPIQFIAQLFKISVQATEVFINEEINNISACANGRQVRKGSRYISL